MDTDDQRCAECGRIFWLPYVDVLSAGFPCQPESLAGKRLAEADERYLWPEVGRIIRELRPRFALLENVPGILSSRTFAIVLGDLAEIGYDCEWECLSAVSFGAEHVRERVFVVAYPHETRSQIWGHYRKDKADEGVFGSGLGFALGTSAPGLERSGASRWRGDVHGIPRRVDRIKALGNAVIPQIAEWIGRRIVAVESKGGSHD
jgi:DNA (cytosine-5)-methyltransferase 1